MHTLEDSSHARKFWARIRLVSPAGDNQATEGRFDRVRQLGALSFHNVGADGLWFAAVPRGHATPKFIQKNGKRKDVNKMRLPRVVEALRCHVSDSSLPARQPVCLLGVRLRDSQSEIDDDSAPILIKRDVVGL